MRSVAARQGAAGGSYNIKATTLGGIVRSTSRLIGLAPGLSGGIGGIPFAGSTGARMAKRLGMGLDARGRKSCSQILLHGCRGPGGRHQYGL